MAEHNRQGNELESQPNRLYVPSLGLLLEDKELMAKEGGRDFFVGYQAKLKAGPVEQNSRLGQYGYFLESGSISNERLFELFVSDLFGRLPKEVQFNMFYADSPSE